MAEITLNQAKEILPHLLNAGVVPFLHSSPAIGKSSIAKQLAKQANLKVIDLRLTEMDASDIQGLPFFKDGKSSFLPFDTFPLEDTPIPDGFNGWLLLLDELNSAAPSVQAAAYKLILDKMVGQHKLHPNVAIIACGNLDTDNAITFPLSSALISRFAHFNIRLDAKQWREWAINTDVDSRITSFIGFKDSLLYTFNPDVTEPYASPRTWEMLSHVIKPIQQIDKKHIPLIASLVGDGVATEFVQYLTLFNKLPTLDEIINNPALKIPEELGLQWAIISMTVSKLTEENFTPITNYLQKLPMELQVMALKEIIARYPQWVIKTTQWRQGLAGELFL